MKVSGQSGPDPITKFRRMTGQESVQVVCSGLDQAATVNGDFRIPSPVKPTERQPRETRPRLHRKPNKSPQRRSQGEGKSSKRTMKAPFAVRSLRDRKLELPLEASPGKETRRSGPCSGPVEPGPDRSQELGFPGHRSGLVGTFLKIDAGDCAQEAQMATCHSIRVGHAVTAQPLAEILRFADVENHVARVAHEIHAGPLRQLPEEIASQPLDKRLRIRKEKLLRRPHICDSTRKTGTRTVQMGSNNWGVDNQARAY